MIIAKAGQPHLDLRFKLCTLSIRERPWIRDLVADLVPPSAAGATQNKTNTLTSSWRVVLIRYGTLNLFALSKQRDRADDIGHIIAIFVSMFRNGGRGAA